VDNEWSYIRKDVTTRQFEEHIPFIVDAILDTFMDEERKQYIITIESIATQYSQMWLSIYDYGII